MFYLCVYMFFVTCRGFAYIFFLHLYTCQFISLTSGHLLLCPVLEVEVTWLFCKAALI